MKAWYNAEFKKTALEIISTGEGMSANKEPYATWKRNSIYKMEHPLGNMTGELSFGVMNTRPVVNETRGHEVRFHVKFDEPYYIAYIVQGTSNTLARDFITLAKDRELHKLVKSIGEIFDGLDFTQPYPQLLSTVMGPNELYSLHS
jgi:hypothetical protein